MLNEFRSSLYTVCQECWDEAVVFLPFLPLLSFPILKNKRFRDSFQVELPIWNMMFVTPPSPLLNNNIFYLLKLPISPCHYMKGPYFVIFVKGLRSRKPPHCCVYSLLDSSGPSNCLNVFCHVSFITKGSLEFFVCLLGVCCVSQLLFFQSWILKIGEGKALHVYKCNPVYNRTVFKIFWYFSLNIRNLARVNMILPRERITGFSFSLFSSIFEQLKGNLNSWC